MTKALTTKHTDLECPECGSPMELCFSGKYRYKNGQRRPYYRCYKYPECSGSHGAHPDGTPLGKPATKETRMLRSELHAELDKKYPWNTKRGKMKTALWLRGNGFGEGHVSHMDAEQCKTALAILRDDVK